MNKYNLVNDTVQDAYDFIFIPSFVLGVGGIVQNEMQVVDGNPDGSSVTNFQNIGSMLWRNDWY